MRAAVLTAPGEPLQIRTVTATPLEADEILVRIVGVGVCHTDFAALSGAVPLPLPAVVGHEGSGVVESVGSAVTDLAVGDHVVLSFDCCRECEQCQAGHPAYCELFAAMNYFGTRLDGSATLADEAGEEVHGSWFGQSSFATHAVASARNAVRVDPALPLELLGPLGCGLMTGAGTVLNVLRPRPGQRIGVWGLGAVGLAAIMAAKTAGCSVIVGIDPNEERRRLAVELGATHTIDPAATSDVAWDILELSDGGLDLTLDAVGLGPVIQQALAVLRSPGTCATVGLQSLENDITIDQGHLLIGRTLTGVIEGDADPRVFLPQLIQLWSDGTFPFDRLVETFPFDEIDKAIDAAQSGRVVKPLLVMP